jgi:hypothetical protein
VPGLIRGVHVLRAGAMNLKDIDGIWIYFMAFVDLMSAYTCIFYGYHDRRWVQRQMEEAVRRQAHAMSPSDAWMATHSARADGGTYNMW